MPISDNFVASERIANEKMVFDLNATKIHVICHDQLVLFVHVTILRICELLVDEYCILHARITFSYTFFAGLDAEYLGVDDILFGNSWLVCTRSCDLLSI